MKATSIVRSTLGLGSILALAIEVNSSAFAGPGPQYWQQQAQRAKARAELAEMRSEVAVKPVATSSMLCPHCTTKVLQESAFYNISGKIAPRTAVVGKIHSCVGCSGSIKQLAGKTTDAMKRTCPVCATAAPNCCSVNK